MKLKIIEDEEWPVYSIEDFKCKYDGDLIDLDDEFIKEYESLTQRLSEMKYIIFEKIENKRKKKKKKLQ